MKIKVIGSLVLLALLAWLFRYSAPTCPGSVCVVTDRWTGKVVGAFGPYDARDYLRQQAAQRGQ